MELVFSGKSQIIFTDQRLSCCNPVEARFYKNDFGCLPCHKCGAELESDAIEKFNHLKKEFHNVLPCCKGVCAVGPTKGWKTTGKTKTNIRARKRKAVYKYMNIDLKTFKPRPIEESLQDWLADSIPAWNQLLSKLNIKRQIKKHKPTQGV